MKVSFDFDSTLSLDYIQNYASALIKKGVEVWIVTSRSSCDKSAYTVKGIHMENMNDDLYEVADKLGISRDNIHFTSFEDKFEFLKKHDFIFHLDDDVIELSMIQDYTTVTPVCHLDWGIQFGGKEEWENICNKQLNK